MGAAEEQEAEEEEATGAGILFLGGTGGAWECDDDDAVDAGSTTGDADLFFDQP
jgi:hypothetical protein